MYEARPPAARRAGADAARFGRRQLPASPCNATAHTPVAESSSDVPCHDVVRATKGAQEQEHCSANEERNEVRCCADRLVEGYNRSTQAATVCKGRHGKGLWTESDSARFGAGLEA